MAVAMLPSQMMLAPQQMHESMACCLEQQPETSSSCDHHSESSSHSQKHHCEDSCALQCHCVSISVFHEGQENEAFTALSYPSQLNFHYSNVLISKWFVQVWLPPKIS